jgi:hypothetical protein
MGHRWIAVFARLQGLLGLPFTRGEDLGNTGSSLDGLSSGSVIERPTLGKMRRFKHGQPGAARALTQAPARAEFAGKEAAGRLGCSAGVGVTHTCSVASSGYGSEVRRSALTQFPAPARGY